MPRMQVPEARGSPLLQAPLPGPHKVLRDFEHLLSPMFREVSLIGEIPLSDNEEIQIEAALRELLRFSGPGKATQFLREEAQCTLACFLVWKGIRGYREGDYWTEVCNSVGLPRANWHTRWGAIFEDVLRRFELAKFSDTGGHRFVTPILIHGGIPDYCLDDFFERLLWPAVTGRLDYYDNIDDLLADWQGLSSLTFFTTDKPVRRFLEQGGKVAADFLQRCLHMALQAYGTEKVSNAQDLGLPEHVVKHFEAWREKHSLETSLQTSQQANLPRYRAPEILLNAAAGCLLLSFPSQRLIRSKLDSAQLMLEVKRDDTVSATTAISGVGKGKQIETDSCELDLGAPGERHEVTLFSGEKPLRRWTLLGISRNQPWMIFHGRSGKLSLGRAILERDFWIVFPSSWNLSTTVRPIEAATLIQNYQAEHFCIVEDTPPNIHLIHPDGRSFVVPVEWIAAPVLSGNPIDWPRTSSQEAKVYCGTPPDLLIPVPFSEDGLGIPERLHLIIAPIGKTWPVERREIPLKILSETLSLKNSCLTLSLKDPRFLGPTPCGRFTIQVRGRLGQDTNFHICILPPIKFNFPREEILPNPNTGPGDFCFTLASPFLRELTVESPAEFSPCNPHDRTGEYQVVVPAESEHVTLYPRFSVGTETIEVPLEIAVPRFRWTISGLKDSGLLHWWDGPIPISLQDLEEAQDPRLLVKGDFGQSVPCSLILEGANHRNPPFILKDGRGGCPLSSFRDSLQAIGSSRSQFVLEFLLPEERSSRRINLIQVDTRWAVEDLQVEHEIVLGQNKRIVLLSWCGVGRIRNRVLRLWSLNAEQKEPTEISIDDGKAEVMIEKSLSDFPHGHYRLEFAVADLWVDPPTTVPSPTSDNVFDLEVGEDKAIIVDLVVGSLENPSADIAAEIEILSPDPQAIISSPEEARSFCEKIYAGEKKKQGDGLALLMRALHQCEEALEGCFAESLAKSLLQRDLSETGEMVRLFGEFFLSLGFLAKPWGPYLSRLLYLYHIDNWKKGSMNRRNSLPRHIRNRRKKG